MRMKQRSGFSLLELMVVVGIILFITALALPNFIALFKSQGVSKAARMVQTAVLQTRNRAVGLGRQQRIQFIDDYPVGSNRSAIVVYDGGEDWDGNGDPWTAAPGNAAENTDEKLVEVVTIPKGYRWGKGRVGDVQNSDLPLILCMPDGSLRVYKDKGAASLPWSPSLMCTTDNFNRPSTLLPVTTNVQGNHDLEVQSASANGDVYYLRFIKPTGRVKIKGDS